MVSEAPYYIKAFENGLFEPHNKRKKPVEKHARNPSIEELLDTRTEERFGQFRNKLEFLGYLKDCEIKETAGPIRKLRDNQIKSSKQIDAFKLIKRNNLPKVNEWSRQKLHARN